jgi:hypothetical protein
MAVKEEDAVMETKKTVTKRKVMKKKLFLCKGVDDKDPDKASRFEVVSGPFAGIPEATRCVKDELPDGKYVLMYEGRCIAKKTQTFSVVEEYEAGTLASAAEPDDEEGFIEVPE